MKFATDENYQDVLSLWGDVKHDIMCFGLSTVATTTIGALAIDEVLKSNYKQAALALGGAVVAGMVGGLFYTSARHKVVAASGPN